MTNRSDRGQILIIGAAAMVVLLAIAGLVIDLGFSWMLRRAEQNAVDPATIAAARYIPDGDLAAMEEAACFYARENGFFPDATQYDLGPNGCIPANDPNGSVLTVNWPAEWPTGSGTLNSRYVEVVLDGGHATFFSKVFGFDWMRVSTNAVAANGTSDSGTGQLVALDPTSCLAGQVRGNGTVFVDGSVYVNSDGSGPPPCVGTFDDLCSGTTGAFSFAGSPARLVTPHLSVRGTCGQNSNPYPSNCISPPCGLTEGAPQIDDPFDLPIPTIAWAGVPAPATSSSGPVSLANCDDPTDTGCSFAGGPGTWFELNPGVYYGGWTIQREVRLNPGFYYIAGGGIQVTGNGGILTIGPSGLPDGDGRILIYGTDGPNCDPLVFDRRCQGPISMAGQGGFQARAYEQDPSDPFDDDYQRILIWQAEGTSRTWSADTDFDNDIVSIAGLGELDYWGTIYAPKSRVVLVGNGAGAGSVAGVQILAWQFDIGGNGDLNMPFDPDELSPILSKGLVQ